MKEYDLESYKRKYVGTKAVYKRLDSKGHFEQGYVDQIESTANNGQFLVKLDGAKTLFVVSNVDGGEIDFQYYPIESGVYLAEKNPEYFYLVQRKITKTYQVGLGHGFNVQSYDFNGNEIGAGYKSLDLLSPVKRMDFSKHRCGILDRHFWWKEDKLYWNGETVAFIKDEKNLLISNKALTNSIKAIWGNVCQTQELPNFTA
jgi:hypothetical protein